MIEGNNINQDGGKWKEAFYRAYKKKDYLTAEKIYLSQEKYENGISDVHAAYRLLKQLDHARIVIILATVAFILTCFMGITRCVS
ncbi:hypothetical protein HUW51_03830 [Adhaeribacter swui]|uniref:Uncharacterized protein n=1 Tax=Adhaeribacter swui TaxID=2086471 RepID=A0A7G7G408_9BACT|nr:hypothetical protein [Adhaeribacter swui]QNF31892.1 hypothetical protein HUW51_03830 [Adhaeribacter swui]